MRLALPPILLLLTALLAGCAGEATTDDARTSDDGCLDAACETEPTTQVPVEPLPDVDVQEAIPLTQGLPERTWTFEAAPGATGHVRFLLRDLASKEAVVMGTVCFEHKVTTPNGHSLGRTNCGSSSNVVGINGGSTNVGAMVLGDWGVDGAARFVVKVSSEGMQANELVVDAVIDNP